MSELKDILKDSITAKQILDYYIGSSVRGSYQCPFHNDKKPSLTVKGKKWTCWACNKYGDIFDFVQEYFSLSLTGAIERIAVDFGYSNTKLSSEDKMRAFERKKALEQERERELKRKEKRIKLTSGKS